MLRRKIIVMGIGNGGGRIVARVAASGQEWPEVAAIDSDEKALADLSVTVRIAAGDGKKFHGGGTAGDVDEGVLLVRRQASAICEVLAGKDLLLLVTCLGGGTGTGGAGEILKIAAEQGVEAVCLAVMPFSFEGPGRRTKANLAIPLLLETAAAAIVLQNDRLFACVGTPPLAEAFERADKILADIVLALCQMIAAPAYIQLDYAHLLRLLKGSQRQFSLGYGAGSGSQRVNQALNMLQETPLLERGRALERARAVLVNIAGGEDLTLQEVGTLMEGLSARLRRDCHLAVGTVVDRSRNGAFSVIVLASDEWLAESIPDLPEGERSAAAETVVDANESETAAEADGGVKAISRPKTVASNKKRHMPGSATGKHIRHRKSGRGSGAHAQQGDLFNDAVSAQNRFVNTAPTVMDGEDLDTPTFIRRGIKIK